MVLPIMCQIGQHRMRSRQKIAAGWVVGGTCGSHAINNVAGETEGHQLGCVQEAPLLESHPQVDVHHLSSLAVQ